MLRTQRLSGLRNHKALSLFFPITCYYVMTNHKRWHKGRDLVSGCAWLQQPQLTDPSNFPEARLLWREGLPDACRWPACWGLLRVSDDNC